MNWWYQPWVYSEEDYETGVNKDAEDVSYRAKCECGAVHTSTPQFHYSWCPMYNIATGK